MMCQEMYEYSCILVSDSNEEDMQHGTARTHIFTCFQRKALSATFEQIFQRWSHQFHDHHIVHIQMITEEIYLKGRAISC